MHVYLLDVEMVMGASDGPGHGTGGGRGRRDG